MSSGQLNPYFGYNADFTAGKVTLFLGNRSWLCYSDPWKWKVSSCCGSSRWPITRVSFRCFKTCCIRGHGYESTAVVDSLFFFFFLTPKSVITITFYARFPNLRPESFSKSATTVDYRQHIQNKTSYIKLPIRRSNQYIRVQNVGSVCCQIATVEVLIAVELLIAIAHNDTNGNKTTGTRSAY